MFSRTTRHRLLQSLFWSPPGRLVLRGLDYLAPRWNVAVLNRSLFPTLNGEYWLADLLPSEPLVLDVGFNLGEFSAEVVRRRPNARVIGFDPARSMAVHYFAGYPHRDRVELVSAGVADAPGQMWFVDTGGEDNHLVSGPEVAGAFPVPVLTLDGFAAERRLTMIDLLKIDAEGYDPHVLEGAAGLLKASAIDLFMFEYNYPWIESRRFLADVNRFLADKPYRLFNLFNGFLTPFTYSHRLERFDSAVNYVGVSESRLARGGIPIRRFP